MSPEADKPIYPRSLAAVIGISRYAESGRPLVGDLDYARHDAEGFADALVSRFGFGVDDVFTLFDDGATKASIERLLGDRLSSEAGPDDRVILFFSGHGRTEQDHLGHDLGYLIPHDFDGAYPTSSAISMTQVKEWIGRIGSRHIYLLADACYSGILARASKGAIGVAPTEAGFEDYQARIAREHARQVLAAGGKEEVQDQGPRGHSPFTYYLLHGLEGYADYNRDGWVTASELEMYTRQEVAAHYSQTPHGGTLEGHDEGDVIFEMPAPAATVMVPALPEAVGVDEGEPELENLRKLARDPAIVDQVLEEHDGQLTDGMWEELRFQLEALVQMEA